MAARRLTRRSFLRGSAAVALTLATASACAYMPVDEKAAAAPKDTEPPVEPKVDGDLVYFNWADYVDPTVLKSFSKEYGVIFPSAKWAQRLIAADKLHKIDATTLTNAELVFGAYDYFADPWYDKK